MTSRELFVAFVFIISTVLIYSCSFTETKTINPAFTLSHDSISRDINSIIVTPEVNVTGKEIGSNGNITTELTINIINSKRLPTDANEQKKIGEHVAILLKNTLKDPNSYTDYKVLFTQRIIDGAVTKSTFVGYSYKSKDLKNYIQIVSLGDQFDSLTSEAIGKTTFTLNDPKIVSAFSYYNNVPLSPIKFNIYKDTDSGMVLLTSRDQGQILAGNNFLRNELTTADFYKVKELGSGKYKIEYLVSDTVAGSKTFVLN